MKYTFEMMGKMDKEIARLKAEVERMASNERMKAIPIEAKLMDRVFELQSEVERLGGNLMSEQEAGWKLIAEVERLTRAGDAMADRLMYQGYPETVAAWQGAKEGKQP